MHTYECYKDSGYNWLGKIPINWSMESFKNILNERNEKNDPIKTDERLSLSIDKGVTSYNDKTTNLDRFKDDVSQYKLAHKGDLVFNSMNMIVGALGVSNYYGCVSPVYYTYYSKHNSTKFYEYFFRNKNIQGVLYSMGKGLLAIDRGDGKYNTLRLKVSRDDLRSFKIPLPPIHEQEAIANFLDEKTAKIDALVQTKEQQIEKLKELRQAKIHQAVTKGLPCHAEPVEASSKTHALSEVEMKDSGVEWIGEIPAHWEVKRFANSFSLGKGLTITKEYLRDEGIFCVNYGEIHSKYGFEVNPEIHPLRCVDTDYLKTSSSSLLEKGDFVFADTSEDLKGSGNFTYLSSNIKTFAGYHTVIAKPNNDLNSRFLAYEFDSAKFRSQIQSKVKGVKVFSITQTLLKTLFIWLPPIQEQEQIVSFLDEVTGKIDQAIAQKQEQITKLKEYKQSLINDVVTGKVRVC
ncbi:restriction endonuclease subunit S [Empedobacter stercoris]|uniref:restriction endonuclease subunit S n=1 Tax=Empedobacter stercoris TaxID=1628248 RepID=UPI001CE2176D|nr:restriction endonuclease subunit S [Empedobacter stercoris]MCA4775624.1 restriction endonuclease subunit S [Empedobacter stercoris]